MKTTKLLFVITTALLLLLGIYALYQKGSKITPSESPEEVVKKFYSYVGEGGSSSLSEAYKLISSKRYKLTDDKFKGIVLNYPSDMKVTVIGSKILKDRAVVSIEYKTISSFGGTITAKTDINLDLDEKSKSWKIDFTGETSADDKTS